MRLLPPISLGLHMDGLESSAHGMLGGVQAHREFGGRGMGIDLCILACVDIIETRL